MSEECADCREGLPEGLDGLYDLAFREMAIVKGKCDRGEVSWNSLPESEQHQVDGFSAMFLEAAEQGHTEAQGHVASMYEDGSGLRKDEALAFEMYTKLALQDEEDVVTQFSLGRMYHDGRGCDQSYELAFEWHTKAALQGYDHSQYCLALLYKYGKGCDQSSEQAFEWCAKAALQGDPWSQYTIADLYHTGDGCDQSHEKAFEWWSKAADQGRTVVSDSVHNQLGRAYEEGWGVQRDYARAVDQFKLGMARGDLLATSNLAGCYMMGRGATQSYAEAKRLLALAKAAAVDPDRELQEMFHQHQLEIDKYRALGRRVVLGRLRAEHLNGALGTAIDFSYGKVEYNPANHNQWRGSDGRYTVELDGPEKRRVKVKSYNVGITTFVGTVPTRV